MTMPHLENCSHQSDGWCLACVKTLWEKHHNLVEHRPWGTYEVLLDAIYCKVKRISIKENSRISLQRHKHRAEVWTCVSGVLMVQLGKRLNELNHQFLYPGDVITIPRGHIHRATSVGTGCGAVFIETQTGDYFGESDIERFEDDFGRIS